MVRANDINESQLNDIVITETKQNSRTTCRTKQSLHFAEIKWGPTSAAKKFRLLSKEIYSSAENL